MRCHICDTDNSKFSCSHYNKPTKILVQPQIIKMVINKGEHDYMYLLVGIHKLSSKKIDILQVNEYEFTFQSFSKKNGKFNYSKAIDLLPWAYNSDIMHQLVNLKI